MPNLRVAIAQINPCVGDIISNTKKIIAISLHAQKKIKADIVAFPEMAITGYPPEDLLLRPELYIKVQAAINLIKQKVKNIYVIVGHPIVTKNQRYNAASVIYNGKIILTYHKQELPNYGVFDEKRYFAAGTKTAFFMVKNNKIALTICEDLWCKEPMAQAKKACAKLMISINASPFDMNKPLLREQTIRQRAREGKTPIIYVNCVGGQDELVFDGGSMVISAKGELTQIADFFQETIMTVNLAANPKAPNQLQPQKQKINPTTQTTISLEKSVYNALVLGVRDYINKNNFPGAIVSVSGGLDSALTLAIAVDAIGKERVATIYMPSCYNSKISEKIVVQQAKMLDVKLSIIAIDKIYKTFLKELSSEFKNLPTDTTEENLQARCRAALLMAISNKKNLIVLSTGNKSEMSVGYATLYGDMVGGFCVLKDVPKTLVYRLSNYRNSISHVIPQSVIDRAPSAELAPNQKDTDTLPPYNVLDEILERYITLEQSLDEIVTAGLKKDVVAKVIKMVNRNEYKRRQAPPGVRITTKAFGRDRRYPITSKF